MEKSKHSRLLINPDRRNYDIATDLPLRRTFWRMADEWVLKDERDFSLLVMDVENFHLLNRWYGRDVGDELLIKIGIFLKEMDRDYNTFSGYLGGDNFAIVYPINPELTETIRQGVCKIVEDFKGDDVFRALFGAVNTDNKDITVGEMCDFAYLALDAAKDKLEQDVCWYDSSMAYEQDAEVELMPKVRRGILNKEFTFYLQPKCVLQTGKIVGAEALMRWITEDGVISPGEFIPILEKNGFINQLDKYIWEEACMTIRRWIDEGRKILPISVNVSRMDIYSMNVVEIFTDLVEKYKIPMDALEIEITESAYVENGAIIKETEDALKEAGFKILIDDFGSGYSSLNMLKDVDADVLKLDMKFLDLNDQNNGKGVNIISAVLNMAHQLDLPTIAEGIENADQLRVLEMLGCEYAQGYFYYKPMPISEYEKLLDDNEKLADNTSVSHKKKHDKSYLQEITEYFWKVADVNPFTGEYHFIRNVAEPDFISTPRPETMGEYIRRYINHGIIHPDDADIYEEVTTLDYIQEELKKGKKRLRFQIRQLVEGRYNWCTFEITRPESFSEENPWVLFSWKAADDDAADRVDTLEIISNEFLKVVKVNFDTDRFIIIKEMRDDVMRTRDGDKSFSQWTKDHIEEELIHPEDLESYINFINVDRLRKHFENNSESTSLRYRRKIDDYYSWVEITFSKSKDFSETYHAAMLYLKEIGAVGDDVGAQEETKAEKKMANDIWSAAEYTIRINFSKDSVEKSPSVKRWEAETGAGESTYTQYVNYLADNNLAPEYREIYRNFLKTDRMIETYRAGNQLESLDYKRLYKGRTRWMRLMMFLYQEKNSGDVCGKMLIMDVDRAKRQETEFTHKHANSLTRELVDTNFKYEIQAQLYDAHRNPDGIGKALGMVGKLLDADSAFVISVKDDQINKVYNYPQWGELQRDLLARHMPESVESMKNSFSKGRARYYYLERDEKYAALEAIGFTNMVALPVYGLDGEFKGLIGVINAHKTTINEDLLRSIANIFFIALENIDAYETIHMMGTMDLLTGLKNRNSYEKDVEHYCGGIYDNIGCIYMDANGLHELNNECGHEAGDKMLKAIAEEIKNQFGTDKTYRIGGDEFVIIITDSDKLEMEPKITELIANIEAKDYNVSTGYAWTDDRNQYKDIIREAEQKMYQNKREYYQARGRRRSDR